MHSCSKEFSCGGDGTEADSIFCRACVKVALKKIKNLYSRKHFGDLGKNKTDLEDFKSSDVQDADERGSLPLPAVQSSVDPVDQPSEQTLVRGFGQGLNGKVSLGGETGSHCQVQTITKQEGGGEEEKPLNPHLFLGLSLLNVLSSHFDPGGQDGPGELQHVDAQQVAQFLSSRVVGHGGLVVVFLLHEGDVAELEHGGDDLEHGCGGGGEEMVTTLILHETRENKSRCFSRTPVVSLT